MGASVTCVSSPIARDIGITANEDEDLLNLEKITTALNLNNLEGLNDIFELLAKTDVLLEGFYPSVLEHLGLTPATLLDKFPRLVIGRLSKFRDTDDYAPHAGRDINYLAHSGVLAAISTKKKPIVPLTLTADFGGGAIHLLTSELAKLVQRSINHQGGVVETFMQAPHWTDLYNS